MSSEGSMNWPSKRIPQGGLFHLPKVKYSQETTNLIKLLMEEARMSMMVRKNINYYLRNGEPLPLPVKRPQVQHDDDIFSDGAILQRARGIRKKSLDAIVASGAYEKPRYRPKPNLKEPIEQAKLRLQETMSGFKMTTTFLKPKRTAKTEPEISLEIEDRIDELVQEINERVDWLAEMEELGEGKKYRELIHSQIRERLSEIKKLEKEKNKQGEQSTEGSS